MRNKFSLIISYPGCGLLLQQPEQTGTVTSEAMIICLGFILRAEKVRQYKLKRVVNKSKMILKKHDMPHDLKSFWRPVSPPCEFT